MYYDLSLTCTEPTGLNCLLEGGVVVAGEAGCGSGAGACAGAGKLPVDNTLLFSMLPSLTLLSSGRLSLSSALSSATAADGPA